MTSVKNIVKAIQDGEIFKNCSHKDFEERHDKNSYSVYCEKCEFKLYPIQTEIGTYWMTFLEYRKLRENYSEKERIRF